jgi:hypothetical protein
VLFDGVPVEVQAPARWSNKLQQFEKKELKLEKIIYGFRKRKLVYKN